MVTITINGKKSVREFQNMAMALAYAAQNGECRNAEKLEIAYAAKPGKQLPADGADTSGTASAGGADTSGQTAKPAAAPASASGGAADGNPSKPGKATSGTGNTAGAK